MFLDDNAFVASFHVLLVATLLSFTFFSVKYSVYIAFFIFNTVLSLIIIGMLFLIVNLIILRLTINPSSCILTFVLKCDILVCISKRGLSFYTIVTDVLCACHKASTNGGLLWKKIWFPKKLLHQRLL